MTAGRGVAVAPGRRSQHEADRQPHQHPHRPPVGTPRPEQGAQHVGARGRLEAGGRALEQQGATLGPTERVDHELRHDGSRGAGATQPFRVGERGTGQQHRWLVYRVRAPRLSRHRARATTARRVGSPMEQGDVEGLAGVDRREPDGGLGRQVDRPHRSGDRIERIQVVRPAIHWLGPRDDDRLAFAASHAVGTERRQHSGGAHASMYQEGHRAAGHRRSLRTATVRCDQTIEHRDLSREQSP